MRLPYIQASPGQLIELAWFAVCAINADDQTQGMGADVLATRAALKVLLGKRNEAADNVVQARAIRAMALMKIGKWLRQLGLDVTAVFGGKKKSLDYLRILPMAPSTMLNQSAADRMDAIAKVLKALTHPATPVSLHASAEKGAKLLAALKASEEHVGAARLVLSDRGDDIKVARAAWFTAYKSLNAALTLKFPDDRERVAAYFDEPAKGAGKADQAVQPALAVVPAPIVVPVAVAVEGVAG